MTLTKFTDYSLRTLIYLALRDQEKKPIPAVEIANAYGISLQTLNKVIQHLTKAGYLATSRGRKGGLQLVRACADINLGEVVRATEDFAILECFDSKTDQCVITNACRLRSVLKVALRAFLAELDRHTLADVLDRPDDLRQLLSLGRGPANLS